MIDFPNFKCFYVHHSHNHHNHHHCCHHHPWSLFPSKHNLILSSTSCHYWGVFSAILLSNMLLLATIWALIDSWHPPSPSSMYLQHFSSPCRSYLNTCTSWTTYLNLLFYWSHSYINLIVLILASLISC